MRYLIPGPVPSSDREIEEAGIESAARELRSFNPLSHFTDQRINSPTVPEPLVAQSPTINDSFGGDNWRGTPAFISSYQTNGAQTGIGRDMHAVIGSVAAPAVSGTASNSPQFSPNHPFLILTF